ncbi:hypothetical protein BKA93DRAFT_731948 [Sparassis latifolia]
MLNIVLLVTAICIVIVLIVYLFFWNRVVGYIFGLIARLFFWSQGESSAWVDIGAIHFSILSGRILFKDVRYHTSNQTIKIVKGQLSWRYWIRRPAEEKDISHTQVVGEENKLRGHVPLLCRIHMSIQGLEWFIYNRTAAYDNIASQMESEVIPSTPAPTPTHFSTEGRGPVRKIFSRSSAVHETSIFGPPVFLVSSIYKRMPAYIRRVATWATHQLPNFDLTNLLPVSIEATKAAIICGNASTPNLLVAEFSKAEGTFGVVQARSKYDLYKQLFNIKLQNASVCYVENVDYRNHMTTAGQQVHEHIKGSRDRPLRQSSYLSYLSFEKLWNDFKLWSVTSMSGPRTRLLAFIAVLVPHLPTTWPWRHAPKNTDDETPLGADFSTLEYAIERKVLEAPELELMYYADVVGVVPSHTEQQQNTEGLDPFDIGNGDLPPEWGMDFVVRGGYLRYGPWADRQRLFLHHTFFPQTFHDVEPTQRLTSGDKRMWTGLKIFIELRDGVTLQIPFREASKDWQWDGKVEVPNRPRKREPASIHVRAGDSSTISYIVPMVAGPSGYDSFSEVHLDTVTVTSSLNDIRLITADSCRLQCHLPSPVKWNDERKWTFTVSLRQTSLFLLRDHVNMLTDLSKDWSTGPPSGYYRYIPMLYAIDIKLHNYELNFYVNDHNIIDKPLIKEDNSLLTLRGTHIHSGIRIPFLKYRPDATTVSFWTEAPHVAVSLTLPRWNIHSFFPTPKRNSVGTIGLLRVDGTYQYHAEVREDNVEQLKLDISGHDVIYRAFGWTVRHFMILRDNYFGSFTHFSTLYEYLKKRNEDHFVGDPTDLQYREGTSNPLEVQVTVSVDRGLIVLPTGLPGYEMYTSERAFTPDPDDIGSCVVLSVPMLQLQLRTNDYYMEMSLNVDTVSGHIEDSCIEERLSFSSNPSNSNEAFVIDEIDIVANRLFGPRPRTSTYVCVWEIHVGHIRGLLSAYEGRLLSAAGTSFGLNFTDVLNAPAKEFALPLDPDATFLKITVDTVTIAWHAGSAVAELAFPDGLRFDSSDLAGKFYRKVTSLRLPCASVKLFLSSKKSLPMWYEASEVHFDANLDLYSAPLGWQEAARSQLEFIARQDELSGRARFLYSIDFEDLHEKLLSDHNSFVHGFYLPQLRLPLSSTSEPRRGRMMDRSPRLQGPPPRIFSSPLTQQSESDYDEGMSEMDRDARLANSRPAARTIAELYSDGRESLSSAEESDDEDLTDAREWDSDYSDILDDLPVEPGWPPLAPCSVLTKQYATHCLTRPSLWNGSPFRLMRNTSPRRWRITTENPATSQDGNDARVPLWDVPSHHLSDEVDTTIFRIVCKNPADIRITPLILPVVAELFKDMNSHQLSPELRFDAIMAKLVQTIPSDAGRSTMFDVHVASLRFVSAQVISPVSHLSDARDGEQRAFQPTSRGISTLELLLDSCHIKGETTEHHPHASDERHMAASLQALSLTLRTEHDADPEKPVPQSTCKLALGSSDAGLIEQDFTLSLGSLVTELGHAAPDAAFATADVIVTCAQAVMELHKHLSSRTPALDQQIIHQVLKYSRQRPVVDPLSTIQPSFLVQKGRPDKLRKSISFKFLVYLRNCLRHLEAPERRAILALEPDLQSGISLDDIISTLESNHFSLGFDDDASNLSQQSLLQELFPHSNTFSTHPKSSRDALPFVAASIHLKLIKLSILHPVGRIRSIFSLCPLLIVFHIGSSLLLQSSTSNQGKNHSNILNERGNIRRISVSVCLDRVTSTIFPQSMPFIQVLLRAQRQYSFNRRPQQGDEDSSSMAVHTTSHRVYITGIVAIQQVHITAATDNLKVEYTAGCLTYASTSLLHIPSNGRNSGRMSTNHSLMFGGMALQACSVADSSRSREHAVLASLKLERGRTNCVLLQDSQTNPAIRVMFGLEKLRVNVPRSALRLYRFIEEWRADYLPGINATIQEILSELHEEPARPPKMSPRKSATSKSLSIQMQISLSSFQINLQVMLGTWLSWEISQIVTFLASPGNDSRNGTNAFGLQMGPHRFGISSKTQTVVDSVPNVRLKLELPMFTLRGTYDKTGIQGLALVELFEFSMKPSDWDTVLSVQQKSGQDFNDLVHLIEETRQRRTLSKSAPPKGSARKVSGSFRMKGFRIGLEDLSSTLLLECDDINGGLENMTDLTWHLKLSDLALSLASSTVRDTLDRGHRSAFVTVDFQANMGRQPAVLQGQLLQIAVTKVHAVMQPTSIGELGDLVDHLQAEVLVRKEERATELADFKEKTRSIMRSLDVKIGDKQHPEYSWLDHYTIIISIRSIGVAFPLAFNGDLQMPRSGKQDDGSVRAFLLSIKSLQFGTQRGESGQATMRGFSFQFVLHFRQSFGGDFSGDSHQTHNRLLYPEVTAQLRSERLGASRRIRIGADVSGFVLDVDCTIPDYIFSLIDVYHQGKDRMGRFTSHIPRSPIYTDLSPRIQKATAGMQQNALPTSNIFLSLTFASGKILMHSPDSDVEFLRSWPTPANFGPTISQMIDPGVEVFNLPVVSVWGEYRAKPASQKLSGDAIGVAGPSTLMFKATVHSSQNILRPTLLPFVTELVDHVEDRFRYSSQRNTQSSPFRTHVALPSVSTEQTSEHVLDPVSGMKISLSLRIDQSKLELTCQPDVNVIAGVNWKSGGFIVNISPGTRRVVFTGSVGGLTVSLKHGFLSDDCVRLDARNLAFNMTFAKMGGSTVDKTTSSISVVLDTEFSGNVRLSRLQDVLCFKAVWLDRIPVLTGQIINTPERSPGSPRNPSNGISTSKPELTTAVLLRLRQIRLDADLGQSISLIKLSVNNMLIRSRLSEARSEMSLSLAELSILASGNISGEATVPNFLFQTVRRKDSSAGKTGRMLDLTMTSGGLSMILESEYQKLIQYRAEPVKVTIYDDWSKLSAEVPEHERRVDVAFTVSGTEVMVIMNVGTIPRLLSYANKLTANLDAQREGASRESKAFRVASSPKPDNPLSAVANAMLRSTRSRLKEADTTLPCIIRQRMSLDLDLLQLVVFPRAMRDPDLAQFIGRNVHARLDRLVENNALPSRRDLKLSFASITTSKITQLNHALVAKEKVVETKRWLSMLVKDAPEAIIFGLPSMDIRMLSHESIQNQRRVLGYDFSSKFTIKKGTKDSEDIYITLNMSLYSWLTLLRKTFAREMEQVQAAADIRAGPSALVQQAAMNRRKALDPLLIPADRRSDILSMTPEPVETVKPRSPRGPISLPHSYSTPSLPAALRSSDGGLGSPDLVASPLKLPISPPSLSRPTYPGMSTTFSDTLTALPLPKTTTTPGIIYEPHHRVIERLTMRQLGEATPDVMHPFFMKKAGFSLEDSLPQYVHEYATIPTESIMHVLLKLYSKQLSVDDLTNTQV